MKSPATFIGATTASSVLLRPSTMRRYSPLWRVASARTDSLPSTAAFTSVSASPTTLPMFAFSNISHSWI